MLNKQKMRFHYYNSKLVSYIAKIRYSYKVFFYNYSGKTVKTYIKYC